MELFDDSQIKSFLSNCTVDGSLKLVIIAAAGVSHSQPSGIPLGKELTEYYLSLCLGEQTTQAMLNRWELIANEVKRVTGVSYPLVRLESIIEKIDDVDKEFDYAPLMDGFREFAAIEPNTLHRHLASLVKRGAKVVTPNFDCGIERAIDSCFAGAEGGVLQPAYDEKLGIYVSEIKGYKIYHYHGAGTDPSGLGATVKRMLKGFSSGFSDLLNRWFLEGYSLLCVGFGCVDYFDATQYFEGVLEGAFPGAAVFCSHTFSDGSDVDASEIARATRFVQGFSKQFIRCGYTEDVLSKMVCFACGAEEAQANQALSGMGSKGSSSSSWKSGFGRQFHVEARDRKNYLIRILGQFAFHLTDEQVASISAALGSGTDSECNLFAGCDTYRDVYLQAAKSFYAHVAAGGGDNYFLNDRKFPTQSRSLAFDFKNMQQDLELDAQEINDVVEWYNQALRARKSDESYIDSLASVKNFDEVQAAAQECMNSDGLSLATKYIIGFKEAGEELLRSVVRHEVDGYREELAKACDCVDCLFALPLGKFIFTSHRLAVDKLFNLLHVVQAEGDDAGLISVEEIIELAMQICLADEPPRIYRQKVLLIMLQLICGGDLYRDDLVKKERYAQIRVWKENAEAYLNVLGVAGAWNANKAWLQAVDEFLRLDDPLSAEAREAAVMLIGNASEEQAVRS